jgi:uncharacterized protein YfiM (DUF2279 family)
MKPIAGPNGVSAPHPAFTESADERVFSRTAAAASAGTGYSRRTAASRESRFAEATTWTAWEGGDEVHRWFGSAVAQAATNSIGVRRAIIRTREAPSCFILC